MYCAANTAVKDHNPGIKAVPLYCRCWTCAECAPRRKKQLQALALNGHPTTFITLTIRPTEGSTRDERAQQLRAAWKLIRRRAMKEAARDDRTHPFPKGPWWDWSKTWAKRGRVPAAVRLYGGGLPFLAVFEQHKSGEPHLHILARVAWIDQGWLSAQMLDLAGSPVVDIRRIKSTGQLAYYVTKYITKEPSRFEGTKRYWCSITYPKRTKAEAKAEEGEAPWRVVRSSLDRFIVAMYDAGFTHLEWDGDAAWLYTRPPD